MRKVLFILTIFCICFQSIFAQKNIENKTEDFPEFVDVRAEFAGGQQELMNFLSSEITYPICARKIGVERNFFVNFIIRANNSVDGVQIGNNIKLDKIIETEEYQKCVKSLEREAIRVIKETNGKWKAGMKDNVNVNCYFTLPITFVLTR